ncbi:nicotinamide mononucleotide transporter [Candidatus Curtissbacteria bacterium]|nr:nicotinamide mononucleotide transporter [Candidatus Curtissbacteria bacterium]
MKKIEMFLATIISAALFGLSYFSILPFSLTEVAGFVTGGICVWLVVKENIWNWPVGILNNIFFIVLFLQARLFADTALQVVYIVLGILGWYWWLKGGKNKSKLKVANTPKQTMTWLIAISIISTAVLTYVLIKVNDSAPFLDAVTTVLSLAAQFLLTKKYIQNWYFWITADVLYIYLYFSRGLTLTAILYAVFMTMCIVGLIKWQKSLK